LVSSKDFKNPLFSRGTEIRKITIITAIFYHSSSSILIMSHAWELFYADYAGRHFPDNVITELGERSHELAVAFNVIDALVQALVQADGRVEPELPQGDAIYQAFTRELDLEGLTMEAKISVSASALRFLTEGLHQEVDVPMVGVGEGHNLMQEGLRAAQRWDVNLQGLPVDAFDGGEAARAVVEAGGVEIVPHAEVPDVPEREPDNDVAMRD
jgi:hypothetical protein